MALFLVPDTWRAAAEDLTREKGVALLLGATDTGKSTFAKFLITHLCQAGVASALVDADIGQSFLGPPTTIGLSLFSSPPNWEHVLPQEIFFVGATSPAENLPLHLAGTRRLVDRAVLLGAEAVVVDTTGLVLGDLGRMLKSKKIDLLFPRFILALQRTNELEPILELYESSLFQRVCRLPPSDHARQRSREERRAYRIEKFEEYFRDEKVFEVEINHLGLEGTFRDPDGFPLPLQWALRVKDLLVGLKDAEDRTLAVGRIEAFSEEEKIVTISGPAVEIKEVKTLQVSSLTLTAACEEKRF